MLLIKHLAGDISSRANFCHAPDAATLSAPWPPSLITIPRQSYKLGVLLQSHAQGHGHSAQISLLRPLCDKGGPYMAQSVEWTERLGRSCSLLTTLRGNRGPRGQPLIKQPKEHTVGIGSCLVFTALVAKVTCCYEVFGRDVLTPCHGGHGGAVHGLTGMCFG